MSAEQIHFFLQLRDQIKLYHWQTRVYSRHIATDKTLENLEKAIDSYVEVYFGKYGRVKLTGKNAQIQLQNITDAGAVRIITAAVKYLQGHLTKSLKAVQDSDLINIKDEIIADLNQLLYLFTLK
jgi:isocitrate/isopropylmalate dehydrogenase